MRALIHCNIYVVILFIGLSNVVIFESDKNCDIIGFSMGFSNFTPLIFGGNIPSGKLT